MNKDFALGLSLEQFEYAGRKSWKQKAGEWLALVAGLLLLGIFWAGLFFGYALLKNYLDPNPEPCRMVNINTQECDTPAE